MQRFGLTKRCALLCDDEDRAFGVPVSELTEVAREAEALINISGHLTARELLSGFKRKVYIDLDPGFTQIWEVTGIPGARLEGHDFFFTIGENIGQRDCLIPSAGYEWRAIRQPVVLDLWPVTKSTPHTPFRTIASWRGPYGSLEYAGRRFGLKAHEWRKFIELPRRSPHDFEIALDIHPADQKDLEALRINNWKILDPRSVAGELDAVQKFVEGSLAEFSVAQGVYVGTNSGWVSDRTVCYLASGRPALVQDTGFGRSYPSDCGLVAFRTIEDAVEGADRITTNYAAHAGAARQIAERYFDSDKVLGRLIDEIGISP